MQRENHFRKVAQDILDEACLPEVMMKNGSYKAMKEAFIAALLEAARIDASQSGKTTGDVFADTAFQDAPYAPEMIPVPAGQFLMGSPPDEPGRFDDEGPQHLVTISQPFAVGRFPVTFDEWDFAQADADWRRITGIEPRLPNDRGWGRGDRPAVDVSWDDAQAYVKWLREKTGKDYRLLSEAEWEYVARAGTTTPFWWGDTITPTQANYDGNHVSEGGGKTGEYQQCHLSMRSFDPNPWGLYRVHGNVWEWCEDDERLYTADSVTDPIGGRNSARRALRGGSWYGYARNARVANRDACGCDCRNNLIGFRCARVRS